MAERLVPLSAVSAPTPPNLPDSVLSGIQAGAIEIHQRFIYNSGQRTLEQLAFIVPANSPVPFPNPGAAPVADHYMIQVDSASISNLPHPSVILAGHAISNDTPTPWGDITGAGVTLTFGYTTAGGNVQFSAILESVSPLYGLYSDKGAGSLSLTPTPQKCASSLLNGAYMFQFSGSVLGAYGWGPYSEGGRFQADGKGNITVVDSGNVTGVVFTNRSFQIAYVVNDDCTGTFSFGGSTFGIQLSRDGKTVNMVSTQPSTVIAIGVGRQM